MEVPRSLQDFLGSGAGDSAPCTIIDGPVRTRSGGTVLQREDDDDGPADEAVNQEDGAPLLRVGAVVDAAAVAFGETYVEQARNGSGPQKFRGTIVAATVKNNFWNVQYEADGGVYATEAQHLTLVVEEVPPPYPVDTSVEARWRGGAVFYPAIVVAAREGAVDLKYVDGDEEANVRTSGRTRACSSACSRTTSSTARRTSPVVAPSTYRSAPRAGPATVRATRRGGRSSSRPSSRASSPTRRARSPPRAHGRRRRRKA